MLVGSVADRLLLPFLGGLDDGLLHLEVLDDMSEVELGRALGAPAVERGADRLGLLEPPDVVAAEASEPADRLLAEVEQLVVEREPGDELVKLREQDGLALLAERQLERVAL